MIYAAQAGGFFPVSGGEKPFIIAPHLQLKSARHDVTVATAGVNVNKGFLTGGISYSHATTNPIGVNFILGISKGRFKAGYTYELPIDKFDVFGINHEVSAAFYLGKKREGTEEGPAYYFRQCGF